MQRPNDPQWAWDVYQPDEGCPWNLRRAGHLFRCAAFGANWPQLQRALDEGPVRTVDRLLRPEADLATFDRTYNEFDASADGSESADGLRAWWLRRMLLTPHPLMENMTLFWHSHFAISNARVRSSTMMREHIALLREHALGNFSQLLQAIARDGATLKGVDCLANRKAAPNPNFAQVLLERYTLGPGNFQAADVSETARAFTGWFVLRDEVRFLSREQDTGSKKVLGQDGVVGDQDVLRIVLDQPAVARLLVRKLDRWLITETQPPDDALLEPLVADFHRDYDLLRLVETMLRSNRFAAAANDHQRVKSPVDFAVGLVRSFEGLVPTARLGDDLAELGQNLLSPPTLSGWEGGLHWINPATVAGRSRLVQSLLSTAGPYGDGLPAADVAQRHAPGAPDDVLGFLVCAVAAIGPDARAAARHPPETSSAHRVVAVGTCVMDPRGDG